MSRIVAKREKPRNVTALLEVHMEGLRGEWFSIGYRRTCNCDACAVGAAPLPRPRVGSRKYIRSIWGAPF